MSYKTSGETRRYWTIWTVDGWMAAQARGFLAGNPDFVDRDWQDAYRWLITCMQERLGLDEHFWPVWLWNKRPDLRLSGWENRGTPCVLLEVELDTGFVVESDYDTWHHVLNDWPVLTEAEESASAGPSKEESWLRVLDFDWLRAQGDYGEPHVQVTTPWVHVGQVRQATYFTAR